MKNLIYFGLFILMMYSSCSKNEVSEKDEQKGLLLSEIAEIVNLKVNANNPSDLLLSNEKNPYEYAGSLMGKTLYDLLTKMDKKKSDPDSLKSKFNDLINKNLPESLLHPDTSNFDLVERTIEYYLMTIYANEGFDIFVIKSKKIEEAVLNSSYLNSIQMKRVLLFSSVIRHNVGAVKVFLSERKSVSFDKFGVCFRNKFTDLQNCKTCYVEKALLLFDWPMVFGKWALDCAIDSIVDFFS
jgi:dihydrofolate reductase